MKRPLAITVVAWLFIAIGVLGFVFHLPLHRAFHPDDLWPLILELILLADGVFLLRGANWARWLFLAWMSFHVAVSFYNSLRQVAVHSLMLILFGWILFRPASTAWFRAKQARSVAR
jgi:hypothetical protein